MPTSGRLVYWGWLRMALGVLQMSLAISAVYAIFNVGFETITWGLIIASFCTTAISRSLYRGKPDPKLPGNENNTQGGGT